MTAPEDWPLALTQARAAGTVAEWLAAEGIAAVHVGIYDTSGTLREKRLPGAAAAAAIERGWSFIDAIDSWDPADRTWTDDGSVHVPAVVDVGSGRRAPFGSAAVAFVAELTGPAAARSGRAQLRAIVERGAALGLSARVGWELECIVLDDADALVAAMDANRCWSALTPAVYAEVFDDLTRTLEAGGVPVHHTCAELGPGCIEIAIDHRAPVKSADDAAAAKLYTKAFFARRGQTATFMAQLAEQFPGLGGHPSLSLWDDAGAPVLAGDEEHGLSKVAGHAIAGIVRLMPELLVMAAHTVNSYRRYSPGNWAPRTASWGPGNYTTALRVVADRPEETRLELRIPGADTAPHLCLAMLLGAAVYGIEHALDPPEPVLPPVNGRDLVDPEVGPLPRTLLEATERFASSAVALELYGAAFVDHFSRSRLAEDAACRRFVPPQERARYRDQV